MHKTIRGFRFLAAALFAGGAVFMAGAVAASPHADSPFAAFPGIPIPEGEAALISGGDVRMRLNPARDRIEVDIISNEYEARLGRIPPVERYSVEVHNRLVDTDRAPYMPTEAGRRMSEGYSDLSSRPAAFPSGYWEIGAVRATADAYGPFMISTNAVGMVDVYGPDGRGGRSWLGTLPDTGYGLHANSKPFATSQSYGCLVLNQADIARIANDIMADRMSDNAARASIRVRGDR